MRYVALEEQAREYPVRSLCRLLQLSPSGYYAWRGRPASRRVKENERLVAAMREVHRTLDPAYGSPRMHAELVSQGLSCGRHRVARLMSGSSHNGSLPPFDQGRQARTGGS